MDRDSLRIILEQNGVTDQEMIEAIAEKIIDQRTADEEVVTNNNIFTLEALIQNETDWRKKAALLARLYNQKNSIE